MQPIKTPQSNFVYKGPTPHVVDLPCEKSKETICVDAAIIEVSVVYSVWEFTDEERESIARGGNVKLGIMGAEPIPPVLLFVVDEEREERE